MEMIVGPVIAIAGCIALQVVFLLAWGKMLLVIDVDDFDLWWGIGQFLFIAIMLAAACFIWVRFA